MVYCWTGCWVCCGWMIWVSVWSSIFCRRHRNKHFNQLLIDSSDDKMYAYLNANSLNNTAEKICGIILLYGSLGECCFANGKRNASLSWICYCFGQLRRWHRRHCRLFWWNILDINLKNFNIPFEREWCAIRHECEIEKTKSY